MFFSNDYMHICCYTKQVLSNFCAPCSQIGMCVLLHWECCLTCLPLLLSSLGYAVLSECPCLTTTSSIWHWSMLTSAVVLLSVFMRKTMVKTAISNSGLVPTKMLPMGFIAPCQLNWRFRMWSSWSGCGQKQNILSLATSGLNNCINPVYSGYQCWLKDTSTCDGNRNTNFLVCRRVGRLWSSVPPGPYVKVPLSKTLKPKLLKVACCMAAAAEWVNEQLL